MHAAARECDRWSSGASGVTEFNTYSSTVSGGPYVKMGSTAASDPSYTHTNVQSGQTYYYRMADTSTYVPRRWQPGLIVDVQRLPVQPMEYRFIDAYLEEDYSFDPGLLSQRRIVGRNFLDKVSFGVVGRYASESRLPKSRRTYGEEENQSSHAASYQT